MWLRLAGKLSEDYLDEIEKLLDEARRSGRRVGFDLAAVTLADRASVAFLADSGVELARSPRFPREWVRRGGDPWKTEIRPRPGVARSRPRGARRATMKTLQRIVPIVAIVVALGGAIYYVQSNAPVRPEPIEVSKAPVASPGSTLPPSDRYANNSAINN